MLTHAAAMLEEATRERRVPGAVLRVEWQGELRHESAHGVTRYDQPAPVVPSTWFDLASLTKILATVPAVMLAVQSGLIELDAPLGEYLPEVHAAFAAQPFRRFLNHSSGAAAWKPFFRRVPPAMLNSPEGKRLILREILVEQPESVPGTRQVYSDIGMAMVGEALARTLAKPLDEWVEREIFRPLGADELAYLQRRPRAVPSLAATEDCPWRGRVLAGEVHDENTWAAGGALGQSGLFGTARGAGVVLQEIQAALAGQGRLFKPEVVARFMQKPADREEDSFRLGFDSPSRRGSSTGRHFGPRTFGHLGFTGVSAWADPDRRLLVVLLTNRVHPTRQNETIKQLRPLVHDAVIEELENDPR
ncbi:MAG: beta-lactamase family protein [Myxococcales bacterium]|nr:beta-lactamase family protein [Myxococcales bacterium]